MPAYNEESGLAATLESMLGQTVRPDQIIVVDDGSTDRTAEIARRFPHVTLVQPERNLGSKARAQNFGLRYCRTDLVLPVDGDTVLAPDYVELLLPEFERDPRLAVAAGAVFTQRQRTLWEQGRQMEYLFGFHWFRPVQHRVSSPTVCSGCCSVFRLDLLREFGGFPERTMVEDIDYTWSRQIAGYNAAYVADAVAYAAEPDTLRYMRTQLHRWKSGWFQNVRRHYPSLWRAKRWLALWVTLSLMEIVLAPITLAMPVIWYTVLNRSLISIGTWWAVGELLMLAPPLAYATFKRRMNPLRMIGYYPAFYVLKWLNFYYDWKALVTELVLVPLGRTAGLTTYHKGH